MREAATLNSIPATLPAAAPVVDAIIRAERIEKYYAQPSQNRIQVISATDLPSSPERSSPCSVPPAPASPRCFEC